MCTSFDALNYDKLKNDHLKILKTFCCLFREQYKPNEYQEEYQRLDLEYYNQMKLVKSIFANKGDLEEALEHIDSNRARFIDHIRKSVLINYEKYHGVSGMSFSFLLERNDSLVKPLLYKLSKDNKAPNSERKYAAQILMEHYQDSTFKENIK